MASEETNSDESLEDVVKSLNSLSPNDFMSGIKSLPIDTISRIQRLKGLSSSQIKVLDNYLGSSGKGQSTLLAEEDGYIPLKNRLTAWWRGNNVNVCSNLPKMTDNRAIEVSEDLDPRRWSPSSISMAQSLWGEGFAEPGGPAFAKKVLSPLKFEASNTILDLSAGLGGTACILAKEHKLWLDAFEPNEVLAASGLQFASRHGLAKKVPIQHVDFETLELPQKKYNQIYSRDSLYMVKDKKNVIKQISKSLKDKGQLLIIDYMLADKCNANSVAKWVKSEPEKPHTWTAELYQTALAHYGITVWSTNDLSEEYLDQIHGGWLAIVEKINSGNFDRKTINALMREGEIWLNRARAIEAGDLTIKRIHGVA